MEYVGNILYDDKIRCRDSRFVIFGAGIYGKKILKYLELNGLIKNVICFCDSSDKLEKCDINGIPVYQTDNVIKEFSDADYLVGGKFAKEMCQTLKDNGIKKIHLFV